jgi:hypothetical protein
MAVEAIAMNLRILSIAGVSLAVLGAVAVWSARTGAQGYTSPPATSSVTIAGHKIDIEYYAPSAHGRKIMGGLVPFDQVWCTGANWATKITSDADLQMGDLKLPKGSYSIWTLPTAHDWTLIINKQTGQFHLDYKQSFDFGRTKMNVKTLPSPVETFRIDLRSENGNQGVLALDWETTEVSIPFTVLVGK